MLGGQGPRGSSSSGQHLMAGSSASSSQESPASSRGRDSVDYSRNHLVYGRSRESLDHGVDRESMINYGQWRDSVDFRRQNSYDFVAHRLSDANDIYYR